jgi:hypothetical protein
VCEVVDARRCRLDVDVLFCTAKLRVLDRSRLLLVLFSVI